ncbi:MAG: nuclear transport factor 2 family protein [Pseudomonadota bacterium]
MLRHMIALLCLGLIAGCAPRGNVPTGEAARAGVDATLNALHQAAADADYDAYFDLYAPDAVFWGTDATEYWPLEAFKAYTKQRFATGTGWTYVGRERVIHVRGDVAWFEEQAVNEKYGALRGSGVLSFQDGRWLIQQYNLSTAIPNDIFVDVLGQIKAYEAAQ